MGFLDFLKGSGSKSEKCAYCSKEAEHLPYTKKINGKIQRFCSKDCSRKYRIACKRQAKNSCPSCRR